jgi:hypothetical protein
VQTVFSGERVRPAVAIFKSFFALDILIPNNVRQTKEKVEDSNLKSIFAER